MVADLKLKGKTWNFLGKEKNFYSLGLGKELLDIR
jgi:hypothetical protein